MTILDVVGDAVGGDVDGGGRIAEEALPQRVVGEAERAAVLDEDVEHFIRRLAGLQRLFARLPARERLAFIATLHR